MDRKTFHVAPSAAPSLAGTWQIRLENTERALQLFNTQEEAIREARYLALHSWKELAEPAQILVHGVDGRIRTEWTYGEDPHPPRG